MNKKKWYKSKTFWVNVVAVAAFTVQTFTGYVVSPEAQGYALAAVNFGLRLITKEGISK